MRYLITILFYAAAPPLVAFSLVVATGESMAINSLISLVDTVIFLTISANLFYGVPALFTAICKIMVNNLPPWQQFIICVVAGFGSSFLWTILTFNNGLDFNLMMGSIGAVAAAVITAILLLGEYYYKRLISTRK